jgi:hypothetical protein
MRIYIIGNDGITLCREPPSAVNEGEIVVASNEELHAAGLSGKRLLALWNALPDIEKRRKVGDRDARSAIEALPEPQSDEKVLGLRKAPRRHLIGVRGPCFCPYPAAEERRKIGRPNR